MRYDDAVASLYQTPVDQFVAERKRLAGELKAAGDKDGAAKLAKLARPPISAWVVNQLWWHARDAFDTLFETAQRLRDGELDASAAHRDALGKLRSRALAILTGAEHGATEATLRRVTLTLSAIAAAGGWEPDLPGALSADRDPPGFEAIGVTSERVSPVRPAQPAPAHVAADHDHGAAQQAAAAHARDDDATAAREHDAARKAHAEAQRHQELEAAAELRRLDAERAQAAAERHRVEAALRTAQGDVAQREREVKRLERELVAARTMVVQAQAVALALEERLAQLDD